MFVKGYGDNMKRLVLSGFLFLGGVMMICTMLIVLSNIDSQNNQGTVMLWFGSLLLIFGVVGFATTKYND